tara:strand:- start:625 stop:2043 length:1419 start_codon:yes stop_codon:yes gene_type:complete
VSNILKVLLITIFITNCSFHQNSKFWTKENITNEKIIKKEKITEEEIFKEEENLSLELNSKLRISLYTKPINQSFINNFDNNNGRINYTGNLKKKSKFKFSKIKNFHQYDPQILFHKNNIIYFDNKGAILKFDNNSKLLWKKNYYSKSEKKQHPILFFATNKNTLIVADNIAKFYALNINTGKLLWTKNNIAPFNSQIKTHKNLFFVIDYKNTLRAYSIKDGNEIWNIKTQNSLIRSQKKLSMVVIGEKIYFNNSLGDISAANIKSGELIWQTPTRSSLVTDEAFFLKTSDIIADKNALYFSNNKNQFFSLDIETGTLNWEQKINSNLRPTLIDKYIFTISLEGYLIIIEKNTGVIIRMTDLFRNSKKKLKTSNKYNPGNFIDGFFAKIPEDSRFYVGDKSKVKKNISKPTGFIVGKDNIYLSTDHGRLLIIDISSGLTTSTIKIDNKKISRPSVLGNSLFVVTENSIIKLD